MEDAELMLQCMLDPKVYSKMRYNHREIDLDKCISFIENRSKKSSLGYF